MSAVVDSPLAPDARWELLLAPDREEREPRREERGDAPPGGCALLLRPWGEDGDDREGERIAATESVMESSVNESKDAFCSSYARRSASVVASTRDRDRDRDRDAWIRPTSNSLDPHCIPPNRT